jgi:hypothetical protein
MIWCCLLSAVAVGRDPAQKFLPVDGVELQPLSAATDRLVEALAIIGSPLPAATTDALRAAGRGDDVRRAGATIQEQLDRFCLVGVTINAESRVSVVEGPAVRELVEQGWRTFLVKVHNEAGITPPMRIEGPNLLPMVKRSSGSTPRSSRPRR